MVTRELQNGRLATLATARPYRFVQMMIPNHRKAPISHNYFAWTVLKRKSKNERRPQLF